MRKFKFADIHSYYSQKQGREQTVLSGMVANSGFTLTQDYGDCSDKITGIINNKPVALTLDEKFSGTIGDKVVDLSITSKGSIAILSGDFEGQDVEVIIRRGWLGTTVKGRGIDLEIDAGVFSLSRNGDWEGEFKANTDLIPFIISVVQSIAHEESLYFAAA